MSMVLCDECEKLIDSDDDPACFIEKSKLQTLVICEWCRDDLGYDDDTPAVVLQHSGGNHD